MRTFYLLGIILTGSLCAQIPKHIVKELPQEIDPRLETPQVNEHIVRPLTAQETTDQEALTAPLQNIPTINAESQARIDQEAAQDHALDQEVQVFCAAQKITPKVEDKSQTKKAPPPPLPLTETEADDMIVTCDDGMYFDSEAGVLVYLKNVHLVDPRFTMDCDNQLKVYLDPEEKTKPATVKANKVPAPTKSTDTAPATDNKKAKENKNSDPFDNINMNFSGVKKISADGNIRLTGKDVKGNPYKAQAEKLTYDGKTGETILTGNNLSIQDLKNKITATGPDSFIRIYENGNIYIKGRQTSTQIRDIQSQKEKKPTTKKK